MRIFIFILVDVIISASETISGVVIQNEWEYELKDDIMTWTFLKDDSDIVMTIENGVCNVDGNIISIYLIGMSRIIQNLILYLTG